MHVRYPARCGGAAPGAGRTGGFCGVSRDADAAAMAGADAVRGLAGAGCGRARHQLRRPGRAQSPHARGPRPVPGQPHQRRRASAIGTRSPQQLLALLTEHLQPRGLPAALGGRVGLAETLIHHQDIRCARTAVPYTGRTAAARAARRLDRPRYRRALAHPRDTAGRHRSPLFGRSGARGSGYSRSAAHGHRRPAGRAERTVRPRPNKAGQPHRRLMTTSVSEIRG